MLKEYTLTLNPDEVQLVLRALALMDGINAYQLANDIDWQVCQQDAEKRGEVIPCQECDQ